MTRRSDLPLLDDECWLDDVTIDHTLVGLPMRPDDDEEGLGLRSLIERPEKLSRTWHARHDQA